MCCVGTPNIYLMSNSTLDCQHVFYCDDDSHCCCYSPTLAICSYRYAVQEYVSVLFGDQPSLAGFQEINPRSRGGQSKVMEFFSLIPHYSLYGALHMKMCVDSQQQDFLCKQGLNVNLISSSERPNMLETSISERWPQIRHSVVPILPVHLESVHMQQVGVFMRTQHLSPVLELLYEILTKSSFIFKFLQHFLLSEIIHFCRGGETFSLYPPRSSCKLD